MKFNKAALDRRAKEAIKKNYKDQKVVKG